MKLEKIKELLREVDASGVSEFEVQEGDFRLVIRKGGHLGGTVQARKRLSGMTAGKSRRRSRRYLSRTGRSSAHRWSASSMRPSKTGKSRL